MQVDQQHQADAYQHHVRQQQQPPVAPKRRRSERTATSCTECRRRKQRCNQGQPCSNCKRRFPEPVCEYGPRKAESIPAFVANLDGDSQPNTTTPRPPATPGAAGPSSAGRRSAWPAAEGLVPGTGSSSKSRAPGRAGPLQATPALDAPPLLTSAGSHPVVVGSHYGPSRAAGRSKARGSPGVAAMTAAATAAFGLDSVVYQCHLSGPVQSISHLPIEPTKQNAMLVFTFPELLYRFKGSFDGEPDHDNPFVTSYVPWCMQSPLLARTSLYISARSLAERRFIDQSSTMRVKGQAIAALNENLRSEKWISDEVMGGVVQFISIEWFFGEPEVVQAHLKGLREMVKLRGGFPAVGVGALVTKVALVDDRAIAMALEKTPTMEKGPEFDFDYQERPSEHFKVRHNSPLVSLPVSFKACEEALQLHPATASILDDIRFLINLALSPLKDAEGDKGQDPSSAEQATRKIRSTAVWIHDRICRLNAETPGGPPTEDAALEAEEASCTNTAAASASASASSARLDLGPNNPSAGAASARSPASMPESDAKPHSLLPDYPSYTSSSRGTTPSAALDEVSMSSPAVTGASSETSPPGTPRPQPTGGPTKPGATAAAESGEGRAKSRPNPDLRDGGPRLQHQQPQPQPQDPLYVGVRLAATLYARAISRRQPFSAVCLPSEALAVLGATWRIPLGRWRGIIGVFLFIVMSIMPVMSRIQFPPKARRKRKGSNGNGNNTQTPSRKEKGKKIGGGEEAGGGGGNGKGPPSTSDGGSSSGRSSGETVQLLRGRGNQQDEEMGGDKAGEEKEEAMVVDPLFDDPKEVIAMAHLRPHCGFAKSILQIGFMQMAIEDWSLCDETMKRGLALQRWLRGGRDDGKNAYD